MITATTTYQNNQIVKDIMRHMANLPDFAERINSHTPNVKPLKQDVITKKILGLVGQMEDNAYLVEFLNQNGEPIGVKSFINRGNLVSLAEKIIGNGLAIGFRNLVILRNRKSGKVIPVSEDRQLIRYLLSGLNMLEITLLDYVIAGNGTIFSSLDAGIIKHKKQEPITKLSNLIPVRGSI